MFEELHRFGASLADRYAESVPERTRSEGTRMARENRVVVLRGTSREVTSIVLDRPAFRVRIARSGGIIRTSCPCPIRSHGGLCAHLWATLVKADDKGHLTELDAPALEWDLRPPVAGPPSPETTHWKAFLRDLNDAARATRVRPLHPERDPGELVYLLDPSKVLRNGHLILSVAARRRLRSGGMSRPRPRALDAETVRIVSDPAERRALELLIGPSDPSDLYARSRSEFELNPAQIETVLPELCRRTRRVFLWNPEDGSEAPEPCTWDGGEVWQVRLSLLPEGDHYILRPRLERPGERMEFGEPVLFLPTGLLFTRSRASRFRWEGDFQWISTLRRRRVLVVPKKDIWGFLRDCFDLPGKVEFELPPELPIVSSQVPPRACVELGTLDDSAEGMVGARLSFDYDGVQVDGRDVRRQIFHAKERRLTARDLEFERGAHEKLCSLGFQKLSAPEDWPDYELPIGELFSAIGTLIETGWQVEGEEGVFRTPGRMHVRVTSGVNWFDVEGGATYGDREVPLPRLLAALRAGKRFVKLGDGTVGLLPEDWLRRQGLTLAAGDPQGEVLRFRRGQAALLDALLEADPGVQADAAFQKLREGLKRFEGIPAADAPPGFQGTLREYQRVGLGWLGFLREFGLGGCLADDMGLGKTIEVLAYLEARRQAGGGPSLVVVPRSLLFNWKAEAARFAPTLRVLEHWGNDRARDGKRFGEADLVLTTYGTLRRDAPFLKDVEFDCVILDEAQAIKNRESDTAKAARLLRGEQRLAISGTPVENHLGELWSLMEFLNPGLLGKASIFRDTFENAAADNPAIRALLARAIRPFILRRTKEQVAPELPERVEQTLAVELDAGERRHYDELKHHYQQSILAGTEATLQGRMKFRVLEALLRLRQAACHPGLIDRKLVSQESSKLEILLERLREVLEEGHKALVFSQFTTFLGIVRRRLDQEGITYEYLDGKTRDREARVRRFQEDPSCGVFLVSLKAGGLGLNLTAAEYVFLLDPWWNPAVEMQAIDRTHRIGQSRRVIACRLVARNTVEEKVIELQKTKRDLAEAILGQDGKMLSNLSREDLELLLA